MLQAHDRAGDFLEKPSSEALAARSEVAVGEKPGDQIGRYRLLQQIGEGGGGVVFMAEQEQPVRRRVALKIVKPGMDTKNVVARFEAERQALALMDHANIAHVYDAGATESGRPYFVMELVRGIKVTEYCDQHSLPTSARLELFTQICDAVQHAHQKGIIHRDIKPSNILVSTGGDGKALPKIIDFGIAKATTNQRLTDKTLFTAFEMLIGTPAYPTANGLAIDVKRYGAGEPAWARPPSQLYRFQKTVFRRKTLFAAVGIISLLLISGLVTQFLEEMLQRVGPSIATGRETTMLREILNNTAVRVGIELTNQPAAEAQLRSLMGRLYFRLGDYAQAEKMDRSAAEIYQRLIGLESIELADRPQRPWFGTAS
ncbi:MAG TPA: serine/threonine-protein kinase [Verrucomicrobiae bacterium]|nr:serine/threonine-protein kinase [Verrucomicrobiae bacterium]